MCGFYECWQDLFGASKVYLKNEELQTVIAEWFLRKGWSVLREETLTTL